MQVEFTEPASIELDDAIRYYDLQVEGLGGKFLDEVLDTISLITKYPDLWSATFFRTCRNYFIFSY